MMTVNPLPRGENANRYQNYPSTRTPIRPQLNDSDQQNIAPGQALPPTPSPERLRNAFREYRERTGRYLREMLSDSDLKNTRIVTAQEVMDQRMAAPTNNNESV